MSEYKLYGSEFSLYSGKVRCYLKKKDIPYQEIRSTINVYRKFIIPRTGVRYVPVLQTPQDQVFQDTTVIIDELEKRFTETSVYPNSPTQKLVSLLLEVYGDEWLVIPAMHYRFYHKQENKIYGDFGSIISPKLPYFIRAWLGEKIGNKFEGFVPKLGITEHNRLAIEASYEQLLADLNTHFKQHDFLLGGRPCIADFGFIGPLYAHLYRDPAPGKLMRKIAPEVAKWVERMISDDIPTGELLANDEIPETLLPVLKRMASEHLPVLVDTDKKLDQWRNENPDADEIDRYIGTHTFSIEGVEEQRVVLPYCLWMFQRPVDFYQSLNDTESIDALLNSVGFGDELKNGLSNRLARPNNLLKFA